MIAAEIIQKARYSLFDNSNDRWTDERLLSLLNDCLEELSLITNYFVKEIGS